VGDAPNLPDDVRQFLLDHIDSVERLEVLLLLHRKPAAWTPLEIAEERRSSQLAATLHLDGLTHAGMVVAEGGRYRIHGDTALAQLLDRVADVYRERHVSVITFIYTKPEPADAAHPVRADPLRAFVDSFRMKKGKGEKDG
jgi:hypothetical protein